MIVEVLGCTSAGKSTFIKRVLKEPDGLQLKTYSRNSRLVRLIYEDLVRLFYFFLYFRHWRSLVPLFRICLQRNDSWLMKVNLFRNFVKRQGEFMLSRHRSKNCLVLLDEGCIHAFSNLFCHYDDEPNLEEAMKFIGVIPMPDVLIRILASEDEVVQRATDRVDPPWPNLDSDQWRRIYRNTNVLYERILANSDRIPTIEVNSVDTDINKTLKKLKDIYRK